MRHPKGEWTDLFLAFRMLLDPRKLCLALKGVALSVLLTGFLVALFAGLHSLVGMPLGSESQVATSGGHSTTQARDADSEADLLEALRRANLRGAARAVRAFVAGLTARAGEELARVASAEGGGPLDRVVTLWASQALVTLAALGLLVAIVLLFVWSYYGSAIVRIAGVELALGERIELKSASAYTRRKHQSFYGPALGLLIAVAAIGFLILLAGLLVWNVLILIVGAAGLLAVLIAALVVRERRRSNLGSLAVGAGGLVVLGLVLGLIAWAGWRVPYAGEVALGLLSPLAVFGGLVAVLLGIWLVLGLPLMLGVVATSNVGVFEAWSRSYDYLFAHPWRYLLCCLVGLAHGGACLGFVYLVRFATEWATFLPLSAGAILLGGEVCEPLLAAFLTLDRVLLDVVFLAFVAGYFFTWCAITYLLMRRWVDGTPLTEVHLEPRDRERILPPASNQQSAAANA